MSFDDDNKIVLDSTGVDFEEFREKFTGELFFDFVQFNFLKYLKPQKCNEIPVSHDVYNVIFMMNFKSVKRTRLALTD